MSNPAPPASPPRKPWARDELLLAINLYYRTPFGRQHSGNPDIINLARALGRSSNSVAMKLSNLTSLDPIEKARGVTGLDSTSRLDRQVWQEFQANPADLAAESEHLWEQTFTPAQTATLPPHVDSNFPDPFSKWQPYAGPDESSSLQKVRLGQRFFRKTVLANYNNKCCITGLAVPELLRASHIVPWSQSPQHRVDPQNGLCLSALYDAAFDKYLITIDPSNYQLIISPKLRAAQPTAFIETNFLAYEGQPISIPERFVPAHYLLQQHNQRMGITI